MWLVSRRCKVFVNKNFAAPLQSWLGHSGDSRWAGVVGRRRGQGCSWRTVGLFFYTKTLQRLFLSQPFTSFCKQKLCSACTIPALKQKLGSAIFLSQPFTSFCEQKLCSAFTIPALKQKLCSAFFCPSPLQVFANKTLQRLYNPWHTKLGVLV